MNSIETREFLQAEAPCVPEIEDKPREECGVVGVWAPGEPVASIAMPMLQGLQHRGESAAGVFVHEAGFQFRGLKGNGRIEQAILGPSGDQAQIAQLDALKGTGIAIGHVRYSTDKSDSAEAAQPFVGPIAGVTLAHNGHIEGLEDIAARYEGLNVSRAVSDSHKLTMILDFVKAREGDLERALHKVLPQVNGAYCLTVSDGESLFAVRDPWGTRPLAVGLLPKEDGESRPGYVVASEPVVFASVGAVLHANVEPGQIYRLGADGYHTSQIDRKVESGLCMYETMYLARPDGRIDNVPMHALRKRYGRALATEHPVQADVVIGIPESGVPAAFGFAEQSGIPLVHGAVKDTYAGRSFIQRGDARAATLAGKLRVIPEEVEGKRVVIVDDSIIKGNSSDVNVRRFYEAGATEVHVRIAAPPYVESCYMGMDTGNPEELIARGRTVEEVRQRIGATSLGFLSAEAVQEAADIESEKYGSSLGRLCMACSTGEYPFQVPGVPVSVRQPRREQEDEQNVVHLGMPPVRSLPLAGA